MRSHFLSVLFILSFILPPALFSEDLANYTLYSNDNLILCDRVRINGGLLGSNTFLQMGYDAVLIGRVVSRGNMVMLERSAVKGSVTLGGALIPTNAQVSGTVMQNTTVPSLSIPTVPVTPGQLDITLKQGEEKALATDVPFRNGVVSSGAGLYLVNGHYIFSELTLQDNAAIYFDCRHSSPSIYVLNELTIGKGVRMIILKGSHNGFNAEFYSHQTTPLEIGNDCRIEADLSVPRAGVVVGDRTELYGKLHAKAIMIGYDVTINHNQFADDDGDGMSDWWETVNGLNPEVNDAGGDPDGDGLNNGSEFTCGTNPKHADTDEDGLNDGDEFAYWQTSWNEDVDPYDPVTGDIGDGLPNIIDPDSDNDGLLDGEEVAGWTVIRQGIPKYVATDPAKPDTDGDKIPDAEERDGYDTDFPMHTIDNIDINYNKSDRDSDGLDDRVEKMYGLDPDDMYTQGYLSDRKYYDMVNRMGEWAVSPVTGHLNPQLPSTSTCILGANIDFGDNASTEMSIDREMELSIFLPQDGRPITFNLEFIDNGTPDANDRFYDIKYSGGVYPNGNGGAPPILFNGTEDNSISWRITDPLYYLKGDYFLNFSCHYDKNVGEQPRSIRLYAYYDDGTRVRMQYISPVKTGMYQRSMHFNLLVAGGDHPAYFRGETAVSGDYSSYIENVVIADFFGNVVREIGKKAFDGYWFQYELGTLNAYTGGSSGIFSCNRLEFDWVHNPMSGAHHCIFAIDEVGNAWDDVQITYQKEYHTQDYSCWSGGVAKETAVIRRGNAVHVAVTRPGLQYYNAQVTIRNRSGADVTSQFTIHKESGCEDYPAFDGEQQSWRENWIIETPATAAAGMYTIEMRIGWWWSGTASFHLIFNRTELSLNDEAYANYGYDEDADGLVLDYDTDEGFDQYAYTMQAGFSVKPFSKLATDYISAVIDGRTDAFEARDAMRKFVGNLIVGSWSSYIMPQSIEPDDVIPYSAVTITEALSGTVHPSHQLFGACEPHAKISVGFSRAIGIPGRLVCGQVYTPSYIPDAFGIYRPTTDQWYHEWSEAWIENPPSGADKWNVFDATEYVWTVAGMSASRRDYGALWVPPTSTINVFNPYEEIQEYYLP